MRCCSGRSLKSIFSDQSLGLGRVSYLNYPNGFSVYKINCTPLGIDTHQYEGPTYNEIRENVSSLDCHLRFSTDTTSALNLVCCLVYDDNFEIGKTDSNERDVICNYTH